MESEQQKKIKLDLKVAAPSLTMVAILIYLTVRDLDTANEIIGQVFHYITFNWAWAFEWYMVVMLGGFFWLLFGRYANKKLGDEEPEFSTASWIFMMFASCTSAAVFFWGTIEVYYYLAAPPFGAEPFSQQAKELGVAYSLFHWGPLPWATYSLLSVAFGYFLFVKKINVIRPSKTVEPLIGEKHSNGLVGIFIDNLYIVALILAMGTSLGLATPLVTECIEFLFGIERSLEVDATIISFLIVFNAICVAFGLQKGIRIASDLRSYLSIFVLGWVLIVGGTTFIMNYFTDSFGVLLLNTGRMLFYTDSIGQSGFPQNWTVFYWAWWMIYGIQMCLFLARISKGRTVRELCLGMVGGLTLTTWTLWGILGSYTVDVIHKGILDITAIIQQHDVPRAIIEIWATLPLSTFTIGIFLVLCFLATITLVNACSYTLAMSTCQEATGYDEPPLWIRVGWSLLVGVLGITLLALGGLKPLQTAIIAGGAPLAFINILVIWAFLKDAKKHNWQHESSLASEQPADHQLESKLEPQLQR